MHAWCDMLTENTPEKIGFLQKEGISPLALSSSIAFLSASPLRRSSHLLVTYAFVQMLSWMPFQLRNVPVMIMLKTNIYI